MEEAPSASFGRATVIEPQISLEKNYFSFYLTVEKQIKHHQVTYFAWSA